MAIVCGDAAVTCKMCGAVQRANDALGWVRRFGWHVCPACWEAHEACELWPWRLGGQQPCKAA